MRKIFLVLMIITLGSGFAFAADILHYPPSVEGGNILVDIGLGLSLASASGASIRIPPFALSLDYCLPVQLPVSVGGLAAFHQLWRDNTDSRWSETSTYYTGGIRGNWHWNIDAKWLDIYTGIFFGYTWLVLDHTGSDQDYEKASNGGFKPGIQVGAHFYFTRTIGAVIEIGYPFLRAGLALKF